MRLGGRLWGGVLALCASAGGLTGLPALAAMGRGEPYQLTLQEPATDLARNVGGFNNLVFWMMVAITLFVMALLLWVMFRYNAKANPSPSHIHHNSLLEVAWTIIPVAILVVIAIPSFHWLFQQYSFPKPDLTIKAIGNQWYWSYEYPGDKAIAFDSYMLKDDESQALRDKNIDAPRLLAVDNEVVVPVNKVIHVLVTSKDVIHSWVIQSFAVRQDAVKGRVGATWFRPDKTGVFYGVCSELCGRDHAFMPIAVRVVPQDVFDKWLEARKAGGKDVDKRARDLIQATLTPSGALAANAGGAQTQ